MKNRSQNDSRLNELLTLYASLLDKDFFDFNDNNSITTTPHYNRTEIRKIIDYFNSAANANSNCNAIIELLFQTTDIRTIMNPDVLHLINSEKILATFNKISRLIETQQKKLVKLDINSVDHQLMEGAINYCLKCITHKVNQLSSIDHDLLNKCLDQSHALKILKL